MQWQIQYFRQALGIVALCLGLLLSAVVYGRADGWLLPVKAGDRQSWRAVRLTHIGLFGESRKARPGIPAHLHTGIDIRRPSSNYDSEPVYAVHPGKVISVRDDGPFAQIIIEHQLSDSRRVWSVYEHCAGITVSPGNRVTPLEPIGRFMTEAELDQYGWQFDHLHFELMKYPPPRLKPTAKTPQRFFRTYSLECYSDDALVKYYYDPVEFLDARWSEAE